MTQIKHAINEEYKSEVFLMDCMEGMRQFADNHFDLAVVDPPYGIGEDGLKNHSRGNKAAPTMYKPKNWDRSVPDIDYFKELKRVSKNQVIWGANHFVQNITSANSSCWIVWDKLNGDNDFADCELAWTSFKTSVRKYTFRWAGMLQGNMSNKETRIHPTQKPCALYDWIFSNYATEGQKILDTHLGSQSSRISANKNKLHFTGFELDPDYFRDGNKRYEDHVSQLTLF